MRHGLLEGGDLHLHALSRSLQGLLMICFLALQLHNEPAQPLLNRSARKGLSGFGVFPGARRAMLRICSLLAAIGGANETDIICQTDQTGEC